jgi:hypothetical protein
MIRMMTRYFAALFVENTDFRENGRSLLHV